MAYNLDIIPGYIKGTELIAFFFNGNEKVLACIDEEKYAKHQLEDCKNRIELEHKKLRNFLILRNNSDTENEIKLIKSLHERVKDCNKILEEAKKNTRIAIKNFYDLASSHSL